MATPIRGTTPVNVFFLYDSEDKPIDVSLIEDFTVTYVENGAKKLEKRKTDCFMEENCIKVLLSQADTLLFKDDTLIEVQIKAKFTDSNVYATEIVKTSFKKILNEEIL